MYADTSNLAIADGPFKLNTAQCAPGKRRRSRQRISSSLTLELRPKENNIRKKSGTRRIACGFALSLLIHVTLYVGIIMAQTYALSGGGWQNASAGNSNRPLSNIIIYSQNELGIEPDTQTAREQYRQPEAAHTFQQGAEKTVPQHAPKTTSQLVEAEQVRPQPTQKLPDANSIKIERKTKTAPEAKNIKADIQTEATRKPEITGKAETRANIKAAVSVKNKPAAASNSPSNASDLRQNILASPAPYTGKASNINNSLVSSSGDNGASADSNHAETPSGQPGELVLFGSDSGPSFKRFVQPEYPAQARRQGISGKVVLRIRLDEAGKLEKAEVVESANELLSKSALDAVQRSSFIPLKREGKAVPCWTLLPISFKLKEN